MAKKSAIQKNLNKEKQVKKSKSRRDRLKAICSDRSLPMEQRFEAQLKLSEMPRNGAKIRLRNRCLITGRPRGLPVIKHLFLNLIFAPFLGISDSFS